MIRTLCALFGHRRPRVITGYQHAFGIVLGRCPRCGQEVAMPELKASVEVLERHEIVSCIERLREEEGAEVSILCDNMDGPPWRAIEVCSDWTDWENRRFTGDSVIEALRLALRAKEANSVA